MTSRLSSVSIRGEDGKFAEYPLAPPSHPEFYGMGHALYSTAPDYMRFLRMYLNKGQLDGKRLLSEKGVETLLSNQIGGLKVGMLKTVVPALTADAEFFPGRKKTHSMAFMRIEEDVPGMRSAGSEFWAGVLNTHCWFDPKKNIVFNQSQVHEHSELAWIFNCVARMGWLGRMTQFKDKAGKDRENASVGLFTYPNLMAADILVYRATHVPVGEDQKQHLELARDIAQKFNNDFGASIHAHGHGDSFFPLPEPLIQGPATRVMSLRDGSKKMSKSDASDYSRINLTDDADAIAQKIRKAKTDPEPLPHEEKGLEQRPEADNLVGIYAALADTSRAQVLAHFGGAQFSVFKAALIDILVGKLAPLNGEMRRLIADPAYIDQVLADGAVRAQALAAQTMKAVKDIVGFVHR
jgi:tryptophanyl-tRNA synthetase